MFEDANGDGTKFSYDLHFFFSPLARQLDRRRMRSPQLAPRGNALCLYILMDRVDNMHLRLQKEAIAQKPCRMIEKGDAFFYFFFLPSPFENFGPLSLSFFSRFFFPLSTSFSYLHTQTRAQTN